MTHAEPHDWHGFDEEKGYELRQVTEEDEPNRWELKKPDGEVVELDDDDLQKLLSEGTNPKGL
jgi:hypothetical protein